MTVTIALVPLKDFVHEQLTLQTVSETWAQLLKTEAFHFLNERSQVFMSIRLCSFSPEQSPLYFFV